MTTEIGIAILIGAAAGLMRGFAGVGSGMLMAPFFVHIFGPVQTVGIIILIEFVATVLLLPSVYSKIEWKTIVPIAVAASTFMPIGSWILISLKTQTLQFGVSLVVTLSALLLMSGWRYEGKRLMTISVGVGAASGLLMALTSLGNPPVMVYLLSSRDSAETNRANFTGYFAITLIALIMVMTLSGLLSIQIIGFSLAILPGFLIAIWIGSRLFKRSNESIYRWIAFSVLLLAGIYGMMA